MNFYGREKQKKQIKKQRNIWILSLFIILLQPKSVSWEEMKF